MTPRGIKCALVYDCTFIYTRNAKNAIFLKFNFCVLFNYVNVPIFSQIKGLPEIGMEPLDPLKIPKIRILQGEGPVNVNAALDDVTVTGFGQTEVLSSR